MKDKFDKLVALIMIQIFTATKVEKVIKNLIFSFYLQLKYSRIKSNKCH